MYIGMKKLEENSVEVFYEFETDVAENLKRDKSGNLIDYDLSYKKGVFKFDKNNKTIELIKEKTDPFFFTTGRYKIHCLVRMLECAKENNYPKKTCVATG